MVVPLSSETNRTDYSIVLRKGSRSDWTERSSKSPLSVSVGMINSIGENSMLEHFQRYKGPY
jgi:hypothetical protein